MNTNAIDQTIPEEAFADLLKTAAKPVDAVALLKEYIVTNEAKSAAEKHLKDLKPQVDALRTDKKTLFFGKFRNVIGNFIVNHVESTQAFASVKVLDAWLAEGKISQADYDEAVSSTDKSYNLVTFKAGK
jgi:hypothetical protein